MISDRCLLAACLLSGFKYDASKQFTSDRTLADALATADRLILADKTLAEEGEWPPQKTAPKPAPTATEPPPTAVVLSPMPSLPVVVQDGNASFGLPPEPRDVTSREVVTTPVGPKKGWAKYKIAESGEPKNVGTINLGEFSDDGKGAPEETEADEPEEVGAAAT